MAHAVGKPAAEQHAARRAEHEHDQAERRVALADAEHRPERRHGELLDADGVGRDQREEGEAEQDRRLQEQRPWRGLRRPSAARALMRWSTRSVRCPHTSTDSTRPGTAPISAARMSPTALSRKYIAGPPAQPSEPPSPWMLKARPSRFGIDRGVEDREVGGMEHRVAEAAQHRDRGEAGERMRHRHEAQRDSRAPAGRRPGSAARRSGRPRSPPRSGRSPTPRRTARRGCRPARSSGRRARARSAAW